METYLNFQRTATSVGMAYFELSCFRDDYTENSFYLETSMYLVFPLFLVTFGGMLSLMYFSWCSDNHLISNVCDNILSANPSRPEAIELEVQEEKNNKKKENDELEEESVVAEADTGARDWSNVFENLKTRPPIIKARATSVGAAVVLLFLLQPSLVQQFALLFSCTRLGSADDNLFLTENLSVQCSSTQHFAMLLSLGLPLFLLYVIGIPVGLYFIFVHNRKHIQVIAEWQRCLHEADLTDRNSLIPLVHATNKVMGNRKRVIFLNNYAFLFVGYKDEVCMWEICIIIRKAILSITSVALAADPRAQIMVGMLVVNMAGYAQSQYAPFTHPTLNLFELFSLIVTCLTFFLGAFTLDAGESGQEFQYASHLTFGINITYVLVAGPLWWKLNNDKQEKIKIKTYIKGMCPEVKAELDSICLDNDHVYEDVGDTKKTVIPDETTGGEVAVTDVELEQLVPEKLIVKTADSSSRKIEHKIMAVKIESQDVGTATGDIVEPVPTPEQDLDDPDPNSREVVHTVLSVKHTDPVNVSTEQPDEKKSSLKLVRAKRAWECKIPEQQLSFGRGDIIRYIKSKGNWHLGVLLISDTYPVTKKARYYPSNLFTPLNEEDTLQAWRKYKQSLINADSEDDA